MHGKKDIHKYNYLGEWRRCSRDFMLMDEDREILLDMNVFTGTEIEISDYHLLSVKVRCFK